MAKVVWTLRAITCVEEITAYIAINAPRRAAEFGRELMHAPDRLKLFPLSGAIVPDFGRTEIREIIHGSYRIVYRVDGETCLILACIHGSRDLPRHFDPDE